MLNEDVKIILKGLSDWGEEVDRSLADGWQWKDSLNFADEVFGTPKLVKAFPGALAAFKAGFTQEDRVGYIEYLAGEFDIINDKAEKIIEGGFKLLISLEEFVSLFKK